MKSAAASKPNPRARGRQTRPSAQVTALPGRDTFLLALLLVVATVVLYYPVHSHPFANFDDGEYVYSNQHVKAGLTADTIHWAFTSFDAANWHPLTWLSHAADADMFGPDAGGHHDVNLLLHVINVMLLFWVMLRATRRRRPSFMVAALFALHPINVESVAWIAERKTLLSMLFFLLAMGVYRNYARRPRMGLYVGLVALFALGLMAKPQIITLPFVLLLWDYWPLRRMFAPANEPGQTASEFAPQPLSYLVMEKLPLLALSAASAVVTMIAQKSGGAVVSFQKFPLSIRLGNAAVSYARYLGKLVWPAHLALFYPHPGSLALVPAVLSLLLLLAISAAVYVYRRHRYLPMGWLWFMGTSVPMIGLVQVSRQAMADRYAYLTFIGLFIAICWGVADLAAHLHIPARALQVASVAVLLGLSVQSYRQIGYWADNMTLWTHALDATSGNYMANNIVGSLLMDQGRMDEALAHFEAARQSNPADPAAYMYIGIYKQEHGQPREALADYQKLIDMTNDSIALNRWFRADTYVRMALAYRQLGDTAKAQECLREDLQLRPDNGPSWAALGVIAQTSGDMNTAIQDYQQSVKVHPTDIAYTLLARALQQQGRNDEVQAALQQAQKLSKNLPQTAKMANQVFAQWAVGGK